MRINVGWKHLYTYRCRCNDCLSSREKKNLKNIGKTRGLNHEPLTYSLHLKLSVYVSLCPKDFCRPLYYISICRFLIKFGDHVFYAPTVKRILCIVFGFTNPYKTARGFPLFLGFIQFYYSFIFSNYFYNIFSIFLVYCLTNFIVFLFLWPTIYKNIYRNTWLLLYYQIIFIKYM